MLADIRKSEKVKSKAFYGQSQSKFSLTSLIDIKRFETLAGVKFYYSKFNSLAEFQKNFTEMIRHLFDYTLHVELWIFIY